MVASGCCLVPIFHLEIPKGSFPKYRTSGFRKKRRIWFWVWIWNVYWRIVTDRINIISYYSTFGIELGRPKYGLIIWNHEEIIGKKFFGIVINQDLAFDKDAAYQLLKGTIYDWRLLLLCLVRRMCAPWLVVTNYICGVVPVTTNRPPWRAAVQARFSDIQRRKQQEWAQTTSPSEEFRADL